MICIGTTKELSKAEGLPDAVRADIAATVGILDSCYGADRDMVRDLGGFVGIVGTVGDFQKLFSEWHIDVRSDVCELSMIIDGYISAVAALCALKLCPCVKAAMLASHVSGEPAGEIILEALGLDAPIHAGMYLGEGSGAVMLMPLLEMARSLYGSGQTFDRLGIDAYRRFD